MILLFIGFFVFTGKHALQSRVLLFQFLDLFPLRFDEFVLLSVLQRRVNFAAVYAGDGEQERVAWAYVHGFFTQIQSESVFEFLAFVRIQLQIAGVGSFHDGDEHKRHDGVDAADEGYKAISCGGAFMVEALLTFVFLMVVLGSTDEKNDGKFAGLAIGLCLTLIHLIGIPLTNTSVNPARSLSQCLFADAAGWNAWGNLWLFIVAPLAGAALAGLAYGRKCKKA